jgi:glycogen debranching enzyme
MSRDALHELGMKSLKALESDRGVLASGRTEAYGCLFGRDSLITALELLRAYEKDKNDYYLELVEKILRSLSNLQGRFVNIDSGEEPGKIIHEYRPERHEFLTQLQEDPWFIYPDGVMRNYDTVDATPLFLIALDEFGKALGKNTRGGEINTTPTPPQEFLPSARAALEWLKNKLDKEDFLTYSFHPDRKYGGLKVQSWMDSSESLFYENSEERPPYPIAPVEVQAYAWSALMRWGEVERAEKLKQKFNEKFVIKGIKSVTLAFALDGLGRKLTAPRSSMGHVLWAAYNGECILDKQYIGPVRGRLLSRDLFVPRAGIRTLSSRSLHFDPMSYHNGSIWPHDTALLAEGLENFGYTDDAKRVRAALMRAYAHFKTPVELFSFKRKLLPYESPSGQKACQVQAWSAAALLASLA